MSTVLTLRMEDELQLRKPERHLWNELDDLIHYFDTSTDQALQIRCGWFSIREEFQWTSEPVNCMNCLARGPR